MSAYTVTLADLDEARRWAVIATLSTAALRVQLEAAGDDRERTFLRALLRDLLRDRGSIPSGVDWTPRQPCGDDRGWTV